MTSKLFDLTSDTIIYYVLLNNSITKGQSINHLCTGGLAFNKLIFNSFCASLYKSELKDLQKKKQINIHSLFFFFNQI